MNLEAGFQFIIFLILFGFTNYLIMLKRYENDLKKRQLIQKNRISNLYPKGTFINIWINQKNIPNEKLILKIKSPFKQT